MRNVQMVALVVLLGTGCGQGSEPSRGSGGHQLGTEGGTAGSGAQGGAAGTVMQGGTGASEVQAGTGGVRIPMSAGSGGASTGMGGSAGAAVTVNGGAPAATLTLSPAPSVDLTTCRRVTDAGDSAEGDCFLCCATANLVNSGLFQGTCACATESADASACASEPDSDACVACCGDHGFRASGFAPGSPGRCTCHSHTNSDVCAPHGDNPADCAICCINAGYLSTRIDGGCVCGDG